jgi:hypothetical protein
VSLSARRAIGEALLVAGGLVIIVLALVAGNERVRERASLLVGSGQAASGVADVGTRAGDLVTSVIEVTRGWASDNVYLSIFAVGAFVLFLAVLKL